MYNRSLITAVASIAFLVFSLLTAMTARADNVWTWSQAPPPMKTLATDNGLLATWTAKPKCNGGIIVNGRLLANSSWKPSYTALVACPPSKQGPTAIFSNPQVSVDKGKTAVVWMAQSPLAKGGLYMATGQTGKRNAGVKRLIQFKKSGRVKPSFGILLRNNQLWLTWQEPSDNVLVRSAPFKARAFSIKTGRPLTRELKIVGQGQKAANLGGENNFKLVATNSGLMILWQLTDRGGSTAWYSATGSFQLDEVTLLSKLVVQARGIVSVSEYTHFRLGGNGRLYRVVESMPSRKECNSGSKVKFNLSYWDNKAGQWLSDNGATPQLNCPTLAIQRSLFAAFNVDKDGNWTLATENPATSSECTLLSEFGVLPCQRFSAPVTVGSMGQIFNKSAAGVMTQSALSAPAAWNPSSGKSVVWTMPQQGLTNMTNNQLVWLAGVEKISDQGAITESSYQATISPVR